MAIMLEEDNFEDFELEAYELEEKLNRYKDALAYIKENVEHLQEHDVVLKQENNSCNPIFTSSIIILK